MHCIFLLVSALLILHVDYLALVEKVSIEAYKKCTEEKNISISILSVRKNVKYGNNILNTKKLFK